MKYSHEMKEFILENYKGISSKELADRFNRQFNTSVTPSTMKSYRRNNHLKSGLTGRFEKGHIPANKGKKGLVKGNSASFKKGNIPPNILPIGTEIILADGYVWVKVDDQLKVPKQVNWKQKHRLIWEEAYGPIPKDKVLIFLDQDRTNVRLDNLKLISKSERLIMATRGLFYKQKELTESGVAIASVLDQVNKKGKKNGKHKNQ